MYKNSAIKPIIVALDNVRSAHNVGAIIRTAEALGANAVWCLGLTPYPKTVDGGLDVRLPHVAERAHDAIAKTALGAEQTLPIAHYADLGQALAAHSSLRPNVYAFEQTSNSIPLNEWRPAWPAVMVFGHERSGVNDKLLAMANAVVEIPLTGQKESLNVSAAAAIAIHHTAMLRQVA